mmetsp:Transcript_97996/g.224699  ORF Transcript_97996/g.224699 Transcript_97996/m.224699 type:complete len:347 (+) Transcript_97996:603-1643(+)
MLQPGVKLDLFRGAAKVMSEAAEEFPQQIARQIKFGTKSHPECACFSPDGQHLVSGSVDGFVEVWNHSTGQLRTDLQYQNDEEFMMHDQAVVSVAFSRDSECLASGSQDGKLKIWKVATGQCLRHFDRAHTEGITCVQFSKDSSQVLTSSFDMTAKIHGLKSGRMLKEFRGHTSYVNTAAYNHDNSRVVTASSDTFVKVYDVKSSECILSFSPPPPPHMNEASLVSVNSVCFVPCDGDRGPGDERIYVCTRSNTVYMMNLRGQVLKAFCSGKRSGGDILAFAVSHRGKWLYAVAEDHMLYVFDTETAKLEHLMKVCEKEVIGLTQHPTRNMLACFATDGHLTVLVP